MICLFVRLGRYQESFLPRLSFQTRSIQWSAVALKGQATHQADPVLTREGPSPTPDYRYSLFTSVHPNPAQEHAFTYICPHVHPLWVIRTHLCPFTNIQQETDFK